VGKRERVHVPQNFSVAMHSPTPPPPSPRFFLLSQAVLTPHVPDSEADILVVDRLHVEPAGPEKSGEGGMGWWEEARRSGVRGQGTEV